MKTLARDAFTELRPRLPVREAAALPPRLALRLGVATPVAVGALLAFARDTAGALAAATVVGFAAGAFAVPHVLARLAARRLPPPSAAGPLGVMGAGLAVACALTGPASPVAPLVLAVAVAIGALLPLRRLATAAPALALALAGAARFADGGAGGIAGAALTVLGFALLGRALFFGTLRAVQVREAARIDGELLRLYDDARLFRLVGRDDDDDDGGTRRLAARTLAARDGCYRMLRLAARALAPDATALYLLDAGGKQLVLKEQIADVDPEPRARLDARVGAPGLVLKKGQAVRLIDDDDGAAVQAHRRGAKSVLAVPLREGGLVRGVLVLDRARAELFSEEHETLALALAEELVALLRTERILDELDGERRHIARIFQAARALGGVVRPEEVVDTALRAARDLAPSASVALVEAVAGAGATATLRVTRAEGPLAERLAPAASFPLDGESWLGRALVQRAALPHVALASAGATRGLYAADDDGAAAFGDLRVVPLFAQGEPIGALVVAVPPGERLRVPVVDALLVAADLAGLALGGARLFVAVERQATTDGLTGLVNRRTLDQRLAEAVARVQRSKAPLAVVLADIDHFKSVNDTYGHGAGDEVLKAVAGALAGQARATDVVARYGGEELCLVLEGTDAEGAARLAERMRVAIKALRFDTDKGPLSVTTSFGVGLWQPGDDGHAVVARADQRLYQAKGRGRDRVVAS